MAQAACQSDSERVQHQLAAKHFASLFKRAYLEASEEVQQVIIDMVSVCEDRDSSQDEVQSALDTLVEALFPVTNDKDGFLGIEIGELREVQDQDTKETVLAALDLEEQTFAERLAAMLELQSVSQSELADRIGVGQPAISMMLARGCRPQRRTVEKIADALGLVPADLWPTIQQIDTSSRDS